MIDTGATNTAIPEKLAILANLPIGRRVRTRTAGGQVFSNRTRINSLKIGGATMRNLDGSINRYLDEVLIGMSTLKHFKMSLNDDTLTLSPKKEAFTYYNTSVPLQPTRKKMAVIKSVICDENTNICHTSYSDHW
jgi:aspartyl protease family protein